MNRRPPLRLPLLLVLAALSTVACGATLWERPVNDLREELAQGKTEFLFSQTVKTLAQADLGSLGDGACWNLGTLFAEGGRMPEAELLWTRSLAEEPSPWREQAGRDLFDFYASRRQWPSAEGVAQRLVSLDSSSLEFARRLFEAYYFQKKDDQAWPIFRTWKPLSFSADQELENQLFFGVLSARAGKTQDAAKALRDLVFEHPASELHYRLESFIKEDETRSVLLGPGGRDALAFQSLVSQGSSKDVQDWLKGRKLPEGFWKHKAFVEGIETVFKAGSRAEAGLRILESIRPGLDGPALFALEYARGRLSRTLGWWPQARRAFQTALPLAATDDDRQKTAWNWLNAWVQTNPDGALGAFEQVYGEFRNTAYFSDVLKSWVPILLERRQWSVLASLWRDLAPRLEPDDRAMVAFILSRLEANGLIRLSHEGIPTTAKQLLEQVIQVQPYSYEALVARVVLGRDLEWSVLPPLLETQPSPADQTRQKYWQSLMEFGSARRMANEISATTEPLDPAFVNRAVTFLQAHGQYRPSLQILYRWLGEPGQVLSQDRARLLYPKAFEPVITAEADREGLDPSLLWGLIREESSFDTDAKSWVGAQGLSQLMPATAAETARGLRMKTFDLSDPADNLKLGARYLATMIRSQGKIYLALMAYNAGGGRIRAWKDNIGSLPEEIFVEAAPFLETRGYVKKILSSTLMYGVLHFGKTPAEMVKVVYPGFKP